MLESGTLWECATVAAHGARRDGSLHTVPTASEFVEDGGVCFLVRALATLAGKDEARRAQRDLEAAMNAEENPFLPFDKEMFVADVSKTHVCLLNKFNVIDHHLLVVTREFEDQERLLNRDDLEALWTCMAEFDGLAFYNGGTVAGASQRHKHLQMIPLPFVAGGPKVPVGPVIDSAVFRWALGRAPGLPFVHTIARVDPTWIDAPGEAATVTLELYRAMLGEVGLPADRIGPDGTQPGPYNLLVTREWMLLLPRSRESFQAISVNSLGFAGSLFVRNERELDTLRALGPMTLLREVAIQT
jgi:ATP adenylyltransferase